MKKHNNVLNGMKSVMNFDPNMSQDETDTNWFQWYANTKSAMRDKAVPNVHETRKMLYAK